MSLEQFFPKLTPGAWRVTSPASAAYNCFAWAAGQSDLWWEPDAGGDSFWPEGVAPARTPAALAEAYATFGFVPAPDGEPEDGFEKIALYARDGLATHAARQVGPGRWTSKLGPLEDVEHSLDGLAGSAYGSVIQFLKRPLPPSGPPSSA